MDKVNDPSPRVVLISHLGQKQPLVKLFLTKPSHLLSLQDFHEEYAREAFRLFDADGSGTISTDDFFYIMATIRTHLLTTGVSNNLKEVLL